MGKKSKKSKAKATDPVDGEAAEPLTHPDVEEEFPSVTAQVSAFDALAISDDEGSSTSEVVDTTPQVSAFNALQDSEDEAEKTAVESKPEEKDALDDILDFIESAPVPVKGKKKKKKKAEKGTDDIDNILATLEDTLDDTQEPPKDKDKPMSKAQLKRLRKKENKDQNEETPSEIAKEQPKALPEPSKKPSQKPSKISALKAKLDREREERERFEREEEERIRKLEEEERIQREEEERVEAERARKAEEKRLRREELKKQGKLLTKAQKAKARKAQEMLAHMQAQGNVVGDTSSQPSKAKSMKKKGKMDKFARLKATPVETAVKADVKIEEPEDENLYESEAGPSEEEFDSSKWATSESSEEVADAWDMDSEEEDKKKEEKRVRRENKRKAREEARQKHLNRQKRKKKAVECIDNPEPAPSTISDTANEQKPTTDASKIPMENLRSPICCILGHVDTGKTKILDKIRNSSVQDKEAGGITQQIGASYFPMEIIKKQTQELQDLSKGLLEYHLPGLLIIDTPGHESFTNLRSRGSSLCDIAILVVDLMHGLEPQTIESLNLLKARKTPFIVALNKVDRIYGWKAKPWSAFRVSLKQQKENSKREFEQRLDGVMRQFQEQGLNCALYYKNKNVSKNISLVPTSAITGEGLPDLLMLLIQLTQKKMSKRLQYISDLQCTVLEVKRVEGMGTTLDVILSNGYLRKGDTIVVCGLNGPIVTHIRALLTPAPLTEIRVKSEYIHLDEIKAAAGVKIAAAGLDDAIAGSPLLVVGKDDDVEALKDDVMQDLASVLSRVDKSGLGVSVQASSIGSMEALLQFLQDMKIPVSSIAIGPVHRKDVTRAGVMIERGKKEFACILAFDVAIPKDIQAFAIKKGVHIFSAEIIYHLFDQFTAYMKKIHDDRLDEAKDTAIFPCVLQIIPEFVFRTKDPILVGCRVVSGIARIGTPLCAPVRNNLAVGRIVSIEKNQKSVEEAKAGDEIALRIEMNSQPTLGRHFEISDELVSVISRQSIDLLKANFKDYLSADDWRLVVKLKSVFDIM